MKTDNASPNSSVRRYGYLLLGWSLLVGGSLLWAMYQETRNTLQIADAAARANISKDLAFRRWATSHGGVYVPPTEHTPPNPYLKVPNRDVVTTTGTKLTLMNPAYMLREMQTDFPGDYGTRSHITSLKLLNPNNVPDAWEAGALHAFEQGEKERVEVEQVDGLPYLRMMRPLIVETGCLKCHGFQGYKVGDIRGGLSTAVELTPYLARERELKTILALTHGAIWLIGLAGLGFSYRNGRRQAAEREKTANKLRESEEKSSAISAAVSDALIMVDDSSALVYWNAAAERILGYRADEALGKPLHQLLTPQRYQGAAVQGFNAFRTTGQGPVIGKTIEIEALHKDGYEIPVELSISGLKLNGRWHAVGILRDITEKKRIAEELRQANVYHRRLIEASLDPLVTISVEGKITDVNQATEKITGRSRSELTGTDFSDYFTEPDKARAGYQQVFAQGFVTDYPLALRHRDGHVTDVLYNASVYRNEAGEVLGVFAAARDITERKQFEEELRQHRAHLEELVLERTEALRESEERFRSIASSTPDHIVVQDRGLRYTLIINPQLGLQEKDMLGKTDNDFLSSEEADKLTKVKRRVLETGMPIHFETSLTSNSGEEVFFEGSYVPKFNAEGEIDGIIGYFKNVSERKRFEESVRQLNEELQQKAAALEVANKELEAFSYSVSHDLRAPLRAVDGFSHILQEDYADKLDDEGRRLLGVVRDNTNRMGQLIDDILKFSRTGRSEMSLSEIDMGKMASDVFAELHPSVAEGKLELEIEALPPARGDSAMMHQVFVNLLSNAIKFTRDKEPAKIKVGGFIEGDEAIYYVKDNGAGFDMQYAGKLFGVFQRLHSENEFEGTGIGLAIVKRIVTRHGGRVWAEGKVNEGATMYFALPRADRPNE